MNKPRRVFSLRAVEAGMPASPLHTSEVGITSVRRMVLGTARDSGGEPAHTVAPDEVVRVVFENDLALWMRADDLLRERGRKSGSRDGSTEVWDIDPAPKVPLTGRDQGERGERGMVGFGIKVLEFFGVDLKQKTAAILGKTLEEKQLKNHAPGLYRCAVQTDFAVTAVTPDPKTGIAVLPVDKPLLVFLHGTMSSTQGSFGDLWASGKDDNGQAAAAARAALKGRYGEHVYGLEHRTLTESPIQNALALVQQLPKGAQLHLVSHSRGGLVGELLCLAERNRVNDPLQTEVLKQLFMTDRTVAEQIGLGPLDGPAGQARDQAYADDCARLEQLLKLMDERQIRVRRFVRVACPARGTTLASGRLDRWLSVIKLLIDNKLTDSTLIGNAMGDTADFLLAVVKERTDPRTLPGLEAMMPGSALTRLLQHPELLTTADLSVIAGDIEGESLWGKLKLLAADWFYGSDHDLVVNTGSMVGGIQRPEGGARFLRDQGEKVTHFNYFANKKSVEWLVSGLAREEGADGGFTAIGKAKQEEPRWRSAVRASRSAATPRPIAVVVPGTMGSAIQIKGRPVWLDYWALLRGGLSDIGWGASDVQPVDLLDDFYGPLLEYLTRTHRVEVFPYDWRLSVCDAARLLAQKLETLLPDAERTNQPVHIVAHSMGGLVTRAMIADGGAGAQVWRRMTALPNSRLLMLGTPNRGSHEAVRWLTGCNPTEARLALLDFTQSVNGIIDIVRRFPGMVELLPFDEASSKFADADVWKKLKTELNAGWTTVDQAALRAAGTTWFRLKNAVPDPKNMIYVAGCQKATVIDYEVVEEDAVEQFAHKKINFLATSEGDGTVSWASGRLDGVPMYYAPDTAHDELCSNTDNTCIFRAYVELLTAGRTDQLATAPPARARGAGAAEERFVLPPQPVTDDLPDELTTRGLSFGNGRGLRRRSSQTGSSAPLTSAIEVTIRHGDLSYASYPVMVGHYIGDTIVSAEAALDRRMHGALSRRRDLGLYPGVIGTHAVFFNEGESKPAGAILVGLGQVGELSPRQLESSVRDALLDYALQLVQGISHPPSQNSPQRVRISALLVGTGAGGLPLRDSIEAMLRGALAANRKLEAAVLDQKILIDKLEMLELYEDVAIAAARELAVVLKSSKLESVVSWEHRCVEEGEGRLQRRQFGTDAAWWQRLEILEERRFERLRFIATTDSARAEETLAVGQLRLADAFIAQACASAASNAEVAKTLFEMLLPNRLKERAPDQRDLVLLLDEDSARFPWELLQDRTSDTGTPPAVAAGVIRQLKTGVFRAQPTHVYDNTVLVVGNPDLEDSESFADLPGARREAEEVSRLFNAQGYDCTDVIDMKADAILTGLHARGWRIMHLAGHGVHEFPLTEEQGASITLDDGSVAIPVPVKKLVSGMVIGKQAFLTPGDVEQMRQVPELVFVNCCHLGKTQTSQTPFNRLAANLGVQFIEMGVKAVVVAGWAVDDAAALTFAQTFYSRMLDGEGFGRAVRQAREETYNRHPGANTWGAYQCYGDPDFCLQRGEHKPAQSEVAASEVKEAPAFFSPSELVTELRNLTETTRMHSKETGDELRLVEKLRNDIACLCRRIPEQDQNTWLQRADVAANLGFVYGEAGLFAEAVQCLKQAFEANQGDCPIRTVEQCANFQIRQTAQEWLELRSATIKSDKSQTQMSGFVGRIQVSIQQLEQLSQLGETVERLNLLGGAYKRLARIQTDSALRHDALLKMAHYYHLAYDRQKQNDSYAFSNWAIACLLLGHDDRTWDKWNWRPAFVELCSLQAEQTRQSMEDKPDFWKAAGLADIEVVRLLFDADNKMQCEERALQALALYDSAMERGASLRQIASVKEQVDFLIGLTTNWQKPLVAALVRIRSAL